MIHGKVLMQALKVRRLLRRLARAKENTIREMAGLPPLMSWWDKCCMGVSSSIRECLCRAFCPCCVDLPTFGELCCPKYSFPYRLCTDGQYPNALVKSFLGFLFGSLLAMAIFFFLCLQMEANKEFALVVSVCLGTVLSLGMAFSHAVRCLVFLALPSTCSSKGRTFLMIYAMVLIINHPVQNFSHNLNVLTDAATCGQSLALNETKKLVEAAASPLMSVIGGIKQMLVSIRRFADDLRNAFKALLRAVQEILDVIQEVFDWLASMVDVCNENMGEPYRKCAKVFEDGYEECSSALGIIDFVCDIVTLVGEVCHIARIGELLCIIAGAIKDLIIETVGAPIKARINDVRRMFYFNVSIKYHFHYNMNQSQSYSEVREAILSDIKAKMSIIDVIQTILDNVMPLTVLLVVVKAVLYRRGYLNKDNYDNLYITRNLYLAKKMIKGVLFWGFAALHAAYYMMCDYGLYWILDLIRTHMDIRTRSAIPSHLRLHVKGAGPMADMFKAMVGILEPVSDDGLDIDSSVCMPHPLEPNWDVYKTVISIFIITFFLTMFEAYGLRLRHAVAACYYPHRERARALWLYNHILQMRGGFLVFMRRQLHRKRKDGAGIEKMSIRSRLLAQFPILKPIMKCLGHERKSCMSCGTQGPVTDLDNFANCDNCNTVYCNDCFDALGKVCTFCMAPVDYGDVADESVETDSSEDEVEKSVRVARVRSKKAKVVKKQQAKRPSEIIKAFQHRFALPKSKSEMALLAQNEVDRRVDVEKGESDNDDSSSSESETDDDSSESTSSYDTDYQHRRGSRTSTSSESGEDDYLESKHLRQPSIRTARPSVIRRPELASVEVFKGVVDTESESDDGETRPRRSRPART